MTMNDKAEGAEAGFWEIEDHVGEDYYTVLARLHDQLQPNTYLEIGTKSGDTLTLPSCPAIAIDPKFEIEQEIIGSKPACFLFQMKSDAFFSAYDPKALLGGAVDMSFITGQHYFELVLRDFLNIEKHAKRNSIVLLHDCIPTDAHIGRRFANDQSFSGTSKHPDWWAGDVWKAVLALKKFRPELQIHAFNVSPTGLVAVTNLQTGSELLTQRYFEIVAQFSSLDLGEYGTKKYLGELHLRDASMLQSYKSIAELFWL